MSWRELSDYGSAERLLAELSPLNLTERHKLGLENHRHKAKAAKHEGILKAALELFLTKGYSDTATSEVARAAGVSTATIYKHFVSKEALFITVIADALGTIQDDLGSVTSGITTSEFFHQILLEAHVIQTQSRMNDILRIAVTEAYERPNLASSVFKVVVGVRYRRVRAVLDEMVSRGLLKPHDTALGAQLVLGMIKELFVWPKLFEPDLPLPAEALAQAQEAIDMYLACYGTSAVPVR